MFTKIASRVNKKTIPLTPMSKKAMPKFYKTTVALKTWGPSGLAFGVTGFVLICYVTEWRAVLQYVPYYKGKYRQLEINDALEEIQELANIAERKINASKDFKQEREDDLKNKNKEELLNLVASKL